MDAELFGAASGKIITPYNSKVACATDIPVKGEVPRGIAGCYAVARVPTEAWLSGIGLRRCVTNGAGVKACSAVGNTSVKT
jgi:hypothetical protein